MILRWCVSLGGGVHALWCGHPTPIWREECEKYGAVNDVVIPRPADAPKTSRALYGTGNFGKVGFERMQQRMRLLSPS
jgi:hypothetical protein